MSSNILQFIKSDLLSHITPSQSVFQNQSNLKDTLEVKLLLFQLINEELIYSNNIQLAETTLRLLKLLKIKFLTNLGASFEFQAILVRSIFLVSVESLQPPPIRVRALK